MTYKKKSMFDFLVEVTFQVRQAQNFNTFFFNYKKEHGQSFEEYWNTLIRKQLIKNGVQNLNEVNRIVHGHGHRKFDLAWCQNNQWAVCEFGHERSGRGYLKGIGRPDNLGLINKWFFDYCRNYYQPKNPLNPLSYTYLYFSFEDNPNVEQTNELFELINKVLPIGHRRETIEVDKNNIPYGRIIIIDCFQNFNQVREMYQKNYKLISLYIKQVERKWNKHQLLMGQTENHLTGN